jgi:uncharacterized membrane protein YeaQ/YmgE (transglycosylase-associated protein family)
MMSEQGEHVSFITGVAFGAALGAIIGVTYSHTNIEAPLLGTVIGAAIGAITTFLPRTFPVPYAFVVGAIGIAALVVIWARQSNLSWIGLIRGLIAGFTGIGIPSWIILGLIAGFISSKIVDSQGKGLWLEIVLGIVGALVGGFLFDLFSASGVTGLNVFYSMIVAIGGAIFVLLIYETAARRYHGRI